jgi:hypothetical protein
MRVLRKRIVCHQSTGVVLDSDATKLHAEA